MPVLSTEINEDEVRKNVFTVCTSPMLLLNNSSNQNTFNPLKPSGNNTYNCFNSQLHLILYVHFTYDSPCEQGLVP
jgi:hypothetical protein